VKLLLRIRQLSPPRPIENIDASNHGRRRFPRQAFVSSLLCDRRSHSKANRLKLGLDDKGVIARLQGSAAEIMDVFTQTAKNLKRLVFFVTHRMLASMVSWLGSNPYE